MARTSDVRVFYDANGKIRVAGYGKGKGTAAPKPVKAVATPTVASIPAHKVGPKGTKKQARGTFDPTIAIVVTTSCRTFDLIAAPMPMRVTHPSQPCPVVKPGG